VQPQRHGTHACGSSLTLPANKGGTGTLLQISDGPTGDMGRGRQRHQRGRQHGQRRGALRRDDRQAAAQQHGHHQRQRGRRGRVFGAQRRRVKVTLAPTATRTLLRSRDGTGALEWAA
jgi:hypothetical protein